MEVHLTDRKESADSIQGPSSIFEDLESNVRRYSRCFPQVFQHARGTHLIAADGTRYIDFFCGAGALNYGHNDKFIKERLISYLQEDGVMHALDMSTRAKGEFLAEFRDVILQPRNLSYKVQFCGPTGSDAVEAALKLARKATGRNGIIAFSGAYHGMTLGSLSATGGSSARRAAGVPLTGTTFLPYESGPWGDFDSIDLLEKIFCDASFGIDLPAAVIVEPVQMEGGIFPASSLWLNRLREITHTYGVLLIVDEIQTGCGRTGSFFCFEQSGINPDIVTLSKSISGYGYPMAIVLISPELDVWQPGEHSGTFRGNQLAFVAGASALSFWKDPSFLSNLQDLSCQLQEFGQTLTAADPRLATRGVGMVLGIDMAQMGGSKRAAETQRECFLRKLIVEVCGRDDEVVKIMPPLNVEADTFEEGLDVLREVLL